MHTTLALFLVLPAVLPSKISISRPKRQCPCAEVMPLPPPCECLAGVTAQCTCLRPTFQPVCPCAVRWQLSQCQAACLHTCISTCARSLFATTCQASCGYSCAQSCMHQHIVPIHVVMPKLVPVERCLPICQESCTRSCTTVFTVETCASLCPQPCERKCINMFPVLKHKVTKIRTDTEKRVLTVKNCLPPCRPRCEPQCIYAKPYPMPTLIEESMPFDNNLPPYSGLIPPFQEKAAQAKLAPLLGKALQKPKNEASFKEMLNAGPSKAEEFQPNLIAQKYIQKQSSRNMQNPLREKNLDQHLMPYEPSFGPPLPTEPAASHSLLSNPSVPQRGIFQQLYSFDQGESTASYGNGMGGYKQYPFLEKHLEFLKDASSGMHSTIPEHMKAAMPTPSGKQRISGLDEADETITKLPPTQQPRITVSDIIEDSTSYPAEKTFYPGKDTELQGFQSKLLSPSTQEEFLQQPSHGYNDAASTSEGVYRELDGPSQVSMKAASGMERPYSSSLPRSLQASSFYPHDFSRKEDELLYRFQQPKLARLRSEQILPRQSGYNGVPSAAHGYAAFYRQAPSDGLSRFPAGRERVLEKTRLQQGLAATQSASIAERNSLQKDLRRRKEAER